MSLQVTPFYAGSNFHRNRTDMSSTDVASIHCYCNPFPFFTFRGRGTL